MGESRSETGATPGTQAEVFGLHLAQDLHLNLQVGILRRVEGQEFSKRDVLSRHEQAAGGRDIEDDALTSFVDMEEAAGDVGPDAARPFPQPDLWLRVKFEDARQGQHAEKGDVQGDAREVENHVVADALARQQRVGNALQDERAMTQHEQDPPGAIDHPKERQPQETERQADVHEREMRQEDGPLLDAH